jgi:diguanylate cyclase (GGDEF)-like protein
MMTRAVDSISTLQWQAMIDHMACGIVVYDAQDQLVVCNRDFLQLYGPIADFLLPGCSFEDTLRRAVGAGLVPEAAGREEAFIAQRLAEHRNPGPPIVRRRPDGSWRRITETRLPDGGLLAFSIDITEQVAKSEALDVALQAVEAASARLRDAIEALPEGFALYDADDRLVAFNERYREQCALAPGVVTVGARFPDIVHDGLANGQYPQAEGREQAWLAERLDRHLNPGPPLLQELPGNRWLRIDERRTRDGGVAGVGTDVTDLIRREQELTELNARLDEANLRLELLSDTDGLTAVANRRHFDRRLTEEWSRLARHGGMPLTLMLIDVDHFKLYNDHHGHLAGDDCLGRIARVLVDCARRPADLVARYGGEEFALLLPHTDADGAQVQAQRLLEAMRRAAIPHGFSPTDLHVTLSIGVATAVHGEPRDQESLVQRADAALYRAKSLGRRRAEFA